MDEASSGDRTGYWSFKERPPAYLKGIAGNKANVVLAAAGYNLAKLLAWFYYAFLQVVMVKKPPKGGSYSNTEPPVQNIVLMMRYWKNNRENLLLAPHLFG